MFFYVYCWSFGDLKIISIQPYQPRTQTPSLIPDTLTPVYGDNHVTLAPCHTTLQPLESILLPQNPSQL